MTNSILGIDISKRTFDICLIHADKEKHRKFDNNPGGFAKLTQFLKKENVQLVHACMESTGRLYEALANHLFSKGHQVSVVNPRCIKGFALSELQRSKTDKKDAGVIARFCKAHSPKPWQPLPPEVRELQEVMRYIDTIKTNIHQEKRRLESGLTSATVKAAIEQHIEALQSKLADLQQCLKDHIKCHHRLRLHFELLKSIIGIGDGAALTYLAEIGYSHQFKETRQLESFCGLAPRQYQSGSSVRAKERISKIGNARMRKALYMPALAARDHNPILRVFAERLKEAGKPPKVIICAVMRKLLRIMYAVVTAERPFEPDYFPGPIEGLTFGEIE
jgi:transposase